MKRLLLLIAILGSLSLQAQQNYTIQGETLSLYEEVDGKLSLLWNSILGEYRYFLKDGATITELKNTRENGEFQEEYKVILSDYVGVERMRKVNFTKPDLAKVIDYYNTTSDPTYKSKIAKVSLKMALGGFVGITNYVYNPNPENTISYQLGAEFEVMDQVKLKRHSLVFQARQIIGGSDYDFNSSQFMLNYRFKFINMPSVVAYINAKVAGYIYNSQDIEIRDNNGDLEFTLNSGGSFEAPGAFGLGVDVALGNGFLTFQYQDIVAVNFKDNGEFPIDLAVGYKFRL